MQVPETCALVSACTSIIAEETKECGYRHKDDLVEELEERKQMEDIEWYRVGRPILYSHDIIFL